VSQHVAQDVSARWLGNKANTSSSLPNKANTAALVLPNKANTAALVGGWVTTP